MMFRVDLTLILSLLLVLQSNVGAKSQPPSERKWIKFENYIGKYISRISKDDPVYDNYTIYEGETSNTLLNYIKANDYDKEQMCPFYEKFNQYLRLERNDTNSIKCFIREHNSGVQMVESLKEIGQVLAPTGNATKRNEPGNCVLALFYTRNCFASAFAAPRFSVLSKLFPYLKFIAVDALKHPFYSLNTDFGILGVPTILLFHQGKPVFKFNGTESTISNFADFITACTYFKPLHRDEFYDVQEEEMLFNMDKEFDSYLILAWSFIVICMIYYFAQSKMFVDLIQLVKRTWHESNETQHHQHDQ